MPLARGPWRSLHDAKNDLTGAVLLLNRFRMGADANLAEVEMLIRRAALRLDTIPGDFPADLRARAKAKSRSAAPALRHQRSKPGLSSKAAG